MAKPGFYNHPKFKKLIKLLSEPAPHVLGHLQMLWDLCAQINKVVLTSEEIELMSEYEGSPGEFTNALLEVGLIDAREDNLYEIHDYKDHFPRYFMIRNSKSLEKKSDNNIIPSESKNKILSRNTDVFLLSKEKILEVFKNLPGELTIKNSELYVKKCLDKIEKYDKDLYDVKDILKKIHDSMYFAKEKDVGKFQNEKAYFVSEIRKIIKSLS